MRSRRQEGVKRGSYAQISDTVRLQLLKMVIEEGVGVVQATKRLKLRYTTGKHIVQRYLKNGQYSDRRFKVQRPMSETCEQDQIEDDAPTEAIKGQKKLIVCLDPVVDVEDRDEKGHGNQFSGSLKVIFKQEVLLAKNTKNDH